MPKYDWKVGDRVFYLKCRFEGRHVYYTVKRGRVSYVWTDDMMDIGNRNLRGWTTHFYNCHRTKSEALRHLNQVYRTHPTLVKGARCFDI